MYVLNNGAILIGIIVVGSSDDVAVYGFIALETTNNQRLMVETEMATYYSTSPESAWKV